MWISDPLCSIGAAFPLVALAGTLVAWRRIGWSMNGTFWGVPVLALGILLAPVTTSLTRVFRFHQLYQPILHLGLVMFIYGIGAVLLFGGTRLLRVSIAPLSLLLLVDPVPSFFNAAVDLPNIVFLLQAADIFQSCCAENGSIAIPGPTKYCAHSLRPMPGSLRSSSISGRCFKKMAPPSNFGLPGYEDGVTPKKLGSRRPAQRPSYLPNFPVHPCTQRRPLTKRPLLCVEV